MIEKQQKKSIALCTPTTRHTTLLPSRVRAHELGFNHLDPVAIHILDKRNFPHRAVFRAFHKFHAFLVEELDGGLEGRHRDADVTPPAFVRGRGGGEWLGWKRVLERQQKNTRPRADSPVLLVDVPHHPIIVPAQLQEPGAREHVLQSVGFTRRQGLQPKLEK